MTVLSEESISIDDLIKQAEDDLITGIIYLSDNPDRSWTNFTGRYVLMEAAGGVVKNKSEELLIIYRRKKWDLPKGKLEYAESPENAAVREVMEECGLKSVHLKKPILKTFHTYTEKNKFILKKTHWFSMETADEGKLKPQVEEDIEKAKWMSKEKVFEKIFVNTYGTIRDVLNEYFSKV